MGAVPPREVSEVGFDPGNPATFPPVLTVGEAARVLRTAAAPPTRSFGNT